MNKRTNVHGGKRIYFAFHICWMFLSGVEVSFGTEQARYIIKALTGYGENGNEATNSPAYVTVHGDVASCAETLLEVNNQINTVKTTEIYCSTSLGNITSVDVRLAGRNSWLLTSLQVVDLTNRKAVQFECECWFDGGTDGLIPNSVPNSTLHNSLLVASTCGERLFDYVVTSENYPDPYPRSHTSTQVLTVASVQTVRIEIDDFDLEDSNMFTVYAHDSTEAPCLNDWMKLSENCSGSENIIWQGCGSVAFTEALTSSCSQVTLFFVTDDQTSGRGFSLRYYGDPVTTPVESALYTAADAETYLDGFCFRSARSFMDCALQGARRGAQSFDYDDTTRMCALYSGTSGQFDINSIVTLL